MKFFVLTLLSCATLVHAQSFTAGVKGGGLFTDPAERLDQSRRYVVGVVGEVAFASPIAVEGNALYSRFGTTIGIRAHSVEFPVLGKFYFSDRNSGLRTYASSGFALRNVWLDGDNRRLGNRLTQGSNMTDLGVGAVFAGGVTFKAWRLKLSPELRYTRWGGNNYPSKSKSVAGAGRDHLLTGAIAMKWMCALAVLPLVAQEPVPTPELRSNPPSSTTATEIAAGTKVPLTLLNTISSKQTAEGDRVFLETLYPILVNGRIVIPPGSYVSGTVTQVKRPGRVKGRGALYLRFDSLTLPNGVTRDFRARIGGMKGGGSNELDRDEGKVKGGGSKGEDARDIAQAAQLGTIVGGIAGAASGRPLTGLAGGAAAGVATGIAGVLLTRGPDVVLAKGSVVEMVLDRMLNFEEKELDFSNAPPQRATRTVVVPQDNSTQRNNRWPLPF